MPRSNYPSLGLPVSGNAPGSFRSPTPRAKMDTAPVEQAINSIVEKEGERAKSRDALRLVDTETQFQTELLEYSNQLDAEDPNYGDLLRSKAFSLRDNALDAGLFETEEASQAFTERAMVFTKNALLDGVTRRQAIIEKKASSQFETFANQMISDVRADPDNAQAYMDLFSGQAGDLQHAMRPEVYNSFSEKIKQTVPLAIAEGMAENGDFDGARAYLDSKEASAAGLAERRSTHKRINGIENEYRVEKSRERSVQIADTWDMIDSGAINSLGDLDAKTQGLFDDDNWGTRVSMRKAIRAKQKSETNASRQLIEIGEGLAAGFGFQSQSDADKYWEAGRKTAFKDLDEASLVKLGVSFARQGNFVPSEIKTRVRTGERSNDPDVLANSVEIHRELQRVSPGVATGAGDRVTEVSALMTHAGMDPREAAAAVIEGEVDTAGRVTRQSEWKSAAKDAKFDPRKDLADAMGVDGAELAPDVVDQYRTLAQHHYLNTGDFDTAKASAFAQLREQRGLSQTSVGGKSHYTAYSPEAMLRARVPGISKLEPEVATKVIDEYIRKGAADLGFHLPEGQDQNYDLYMDDDAKAAAAQGREFMYTLREISPNGVPTYRYVTKKDGTRVHLKLSLPSSAFVMQSDAVANHLRGEKEAVDDAKLDDIDRAVAQWRRRGRNQNKRPTQTPIERTITEAGR